MGTTGQSITLANSIIGVGILAMPFCFQQCGVLLATLILLLMGLVSRLCCYFLLKSALLARRRNFEFLAFHVFGPAGKLAVEVGIIGFLMGTCIAYFVVVGDLGPQIIAKIFNINQSDILRTSIMVIVSLVCVLPLGLLRNVDSLSNVSAATIGFYFCLVIKVISEAASQLLVGDWHTKLEMWKPAGVLQCVPIFSMALFCQTQLFEIFESLPSLSLEKMNVVTKNAINICTGVYFTLGLFGYMAFCTQNISGNILMSLSPTMASDVIKLGFVMSLAFSFPLIIFPCRASLYSCLYRKVHSSQHDHIINHSIPEGTFRCITVAIVAVALFISLLIPNIELVLGLVGSTIGVLICVVFPAACFVNVTFKNTNERVLAKVVLMLGLIIMVLGTYANLQAADQQHDKYDDKYITQERIDKIVEDFFESQKFEKSEGVIVKPMAKIAPIPDEDVNKILKEKDSEVQPPNPVPPESQSNEKSKISNNEAVKEDDIKLKQVLTVKTEDKVLEIHPKNLKLKLEEKLPNSENNVANNEINKPKEDKVKPLSNQDKINMMKQQKLIETIKQHGEEQKELIKEQKEILVEIKKTKKEMQQNKKEVDSNEAKKIAVESIQKIANMAIQSLSGVSEKPTGENENTEKKSEPLEKIANEAVQEIAKKAVETIEAIKEINEKPKDTLVVNADSNKVDTPVNIANNQPIQNVPNPVPIQNNLQANVENAQPHIQNQVADEKFNNLVNAQAVNNVQMNKAQQVNAIHVQPNFDNVQQDVNKNAQIDQASDNKLAINQLVQNIINNNEQNVIENQDNNNNIEKTKTHSHSPDEPQSYKQGEDLQKNNELKLPNNIIVPNVPLPIAMNGNSLYKSEVVRKSDNVDNANRNINSIVQNNVNNIQNNAVKDELIDNNNPNLVRQKREVVDCTEKALLKPEDKEICDTLVASPEFKRDVQDYLPSNVDLNVVALPKSLPLDTNLIHHIRSLKSYHESEKKR